MRPPRNPPGTVLDHTITSGKGRSIPPRPTPNSHTPRPPFPPLGAALWVTAGGRTTVGCRGCFIAAKKPAILLFVVVTPADSCCESAGFYFLWRLNHGNPSGTSEIDLPHGAAD
jgi:hypothetical protein